MTQETSRVGGERVRSRHVDTTAAGYPRPPNRRVVLLTPSPPMNQTKEGGKTKEGRFVSTKENTKRQR